MHATIRTKDGITILDLEGHIDFETARPFREQCKEIFRESNPNSKSPIVFNMKGLKFVGSSGLSSFIQTLKEFNSGRIKPRFVGVASEFKKLFKIYTPDEAFEIYASEDEALINIEKY